MIVGEGLGVGASERDELGALDLEDVGSPGQSSDGALESVADADGVGDLGEGAGCSGDPFGCCCTY